MAILKLKFPESFWQEEPRTLLVSKQRKRFWGVLLDLYAEMARVCEKNGLRYFAGGGTLLGALRHKGMIPWDDDIDLLMPRDDYERLCEIAPAEFRAPYFWQTNTTDPGSARGHAQLRNSSTTGILKDEMVNGRALFDFNQGLFIDIFPLDCLPDDPGERKRFCLGIEGLRRKIFRVRLGLGLYRRFHLWNLRHPSHLLSWLTGLWWQGVQRFTGYDRLVRLVEKRERLARSYNGKGMERCATIEYWSMWHEGLYHRCAGFDRMERVPFENLTIPIPGHAVEMLEGQYGDWHRHVIGGAIHGGILIDVDRPYTDYLQR